MTEKAYPVRRNWADSFSLMAKKPVVILPFVIIGFLEALALELLYFSTRTPLSFIMKPIINKAFGPGFTHYPFYLFKLPKMFYYSQVVIYIFAAALLMAIAINVIKNIKEGLPLRPPALLKNAIQRYFAIFAFAFLMVLLLLVMKKADTFIFSKAIKITPKLGSALLTLFMFITNIFMQTFFVLTLPIIVLKKKSLIAALGQSIALGARYFGNIFLLILLPFMISLPMILLKSYSAAFAEKAFPEIVVMILGFGIVITTLLECFIIVCATNFVMETVKEDAGK